MPAKTAKVADVFGNRAFKTVTQSAANAITFEQIQFGVGLFQGVALVLSRVEWFPPAATLQEIVAGTDDFQMAICNRDDLATLSATNQSVMVLKHVAPVVAGAAANLQDIELPLISDLSTIPGGGLIMPSNPIYLGIDSIGAANPLVCNAILYFVFRQLTDSEYVELIQTIMPANL